jgi:hypothetical protein
VANRLIKYKCRCETGGEGGIILLDWRPTRSTSRLRLCDSRDRAWWSNPLIGFSSLRDVKSLDVVDSEASGEIETHGEGGIRIPWCLSVSGRFPPTLCTVYAHLHNPKRARAAKAHLNRVSGNANGAEQFRRYFLSCFVLQDQVRILVRTGYRIP